MPHAPLPFATCMRGPARRVFDAEAEPICAQPGLRTRSALRAVVHPALLCEGSLLAVRPWQLSCDYGNFHISARRASEWNNFKGWV
eukprot:2630044-Pleurochrysis_carterae.AAC.7